ncbi:MAG: hypothetical protein KAS32_03805 [Candidatus Peribacteraceae bacterium]|nr:hypothetical protein [Candidatus Peribacteraceae bacterium]
MDYNFAKVDDIEIGTKIGLVMNENLLFTGNVLEITYSGVNIITGEKYLGGCMEWKHGDIISFSVNDGHNKDIVLI